MGLSTLIKISILASINNYEQWKKEYISKKSTRKYLSDKQIRSVYDEDVQLVKNEKRRVADSKAKQVKAQQNALKEKIDNLYLSLLKSEFQF